MNSIIEIFYSHGCLIQQDALDYINSKENPEKFAEMLIKECNELPCVINQLFINELERKFGKTDDKEEQKNGNNGGEIIVENVLNIAKEINEKKIIEEKSEVIKELNQNNEKIGEETLSKNESEIVKELKEKIGKEINSENTSDMSNEIKEIQTKKRTPTTTPPTNYNPLAKEYSVELKIIQDISGSSNCEGKLDDFVRYFKDRFETIKKFLKERKEMALTTTISKINKYSSSEQRAIGIVSEVRKTTKGHKMFKLEDDTGEVLTLIPQNSELINLNIINDEVIGVVGKMSQQNLFIVQNVIFPEFNKTVRNKAEIPIEVAFISDTHIGSNTFLKKEWQKFLEWINSNKESEKIKYLVIGGDVVDGIGNYPHQEEELEINDIFSQYEELSKQLINIPDYIKVIILPGNHDAVRQAEPQPTFPNEIKKYFDSNIKFVGNPCYFSLHNVEILAYHGRSFDDWIQELSTDYSHAVEIMKEMLRRRHLAPVYGGKVAISPENKDYLVIDKIPDIFITGHGHSWGVENYKGITLINSSTWQSQTLYQKMLNQMPIPCKATIVNLQSMEWKVKSFA